MEKAKKLLRNTISDRMGCMVFQGYKNPAGYGRVRIDGRMQMAHRVVYERLIGPIPEGHVVCHACDNPSCIRPEHLNAGTHADNARDRDRKGRTRGYCGAFGEANSMSKLTDEKVRHILKLLNEGILLKKDIAKQFDISETTLGKIDKGIAWPHIERIQNDQ